MSQSAEDGWSIEVVMVSSLSSRLVLLGIQHVGSLCNRYHHDLCASSPAMESVRNRLVGPALVCSPTSPGGWRSGQVVWWADLVMLEVGTEPLCLFGRAKARSFSSAVEGLRLFVDVVDERMYRQLRLGKGSVLEGMRWHPSLRGGVEGLWRLLPC